MCCRPREKHHFCEERKNSLDKNEGPFADPVFLGWKTKNRTTWLFHSGDLACGQNASSNQQHSLAPFVHCESVSSSLFHPPADYAADKQYV